MDEIISALEKASKQKVSKNGLNIEFIHNPSEDVQIIAIRNNV
jgi:hypothetical protein